MVRGGTVWLVQPVHDEAAATGPGPASCGALTSAPTASAARPVRRATMRPPPGSSGWSTARTCGDDTGIRNLHAEPHEHRWGDDGRLGAARRQGGERDGRDWGGDQVNSARRAQHDRRERGIRRLGNAS